MNVSARIAETVKMLTPPEAPWWELQLPESLGSSIYQHNVPSPAGIYDMSSAMQRISARCFSTRHRMSRRHVQVWTILLDIGVCSHVQQGDPLLKQMRKSVAHCFFSSEVNRMNTVCTKHVEEWEATFLENLVDTDAAFDPSIELPKVVFKSIVEAAFEYEAKPDKFNTFTSNFEVAVREFTSRQPLNPLRKAHGFMILEVLETRKCCFTLQNFAKKIFKASRENPNKSECTTLIKATESNPYGM